MGYTVDDISDCMCHNGVMWSVVANSHIHTQLSQVLEQHVDAHVCAFTQNSSLQVIVVTRLSYDQQSVHIHVYEITQSICGHTLSV